MVALKRVLRAYARSKVSPTIALTMNMRIHTTVRKFGASKSPAVLSSLASTARSNVRGKNRGK